MVVSILGEAATFPWLMKLYLEVQKITAHAWLSPPYEETVLGPMSLKDGATVAGPALRT